MAPDQQSGKKVRFDFSVAPQDAVELNTEANNVDSEHRFSTYNTYYRHTFE